MRIAYSNLRHKIVLDRTGVPKLIIFSFYKFQRLLIIYTKYINIRNYRKKVKSPVSLIKALIVKRILLLKLFQVVTASPIKDLQMFH